MDRQPTARAATCRTADHRAPPAQGGIPLYPAGHASHPTRRSPAVRPHAACLAAAAPAAAARPAAAREERPARVRLAVSTYSYWHFKESKYPVERVIEDAARLGFDGVEILHRQMDGESPEYVNRLKQAAFRRGLAMPMLSIHQDFVSPDAKERQTAIDHTRRCIELAARLGIPAVRLNSGRWKTIKSFDDLMKVKGEEPPLPGYTLDRMRSGGASRASAPACPTPSGTAWCSRSRTTGASPPTSSTCCTSTGRWRRPGSASTSTPATFPATRTPASNGSRRTRPSCRQDVLRRRRVVHARPRLPAHRPHPAEGRLQRVGLAGDGRQGAAGDRGAQEPRRAPRGIRAEPWS